MLFSSGVSGGVSGVTGMIRRGMSLSSSSSRRIFSVGAVSTTGVEEISGSDGVSDCISGRDVGTIGSVSGTTEEVGGPKRDSGAGVVGTISADETGTSERDTPVEILGAGVPKGDSETGTDSGTAGAAERPSRMVLVLSETS